MHAFKKFVEDYFTAKHSCEDLILTEQQTASINEAIDNLTSSELESAREMLDNFYWIEIPDSLIKLVFKKDLDTAAEIYDGEIWESDIRESFIDNLFKHMGLPIDDISITREEFANLFQAKAPEFNITML